MRPNKNHANIADAVTILIKPEMAADVQICTCTVKVENTKAYARRRPHFAVGFCRICSKS